MIFTQLDNDMVPSSDSPVQPPLSSSIQADEIVSFLKKNLLYKDIRQRILYQRIIDQAARSRDITIAPKEIQAEADRLRREFRLERAAETLAWITEQQITVEDWEAGIHDRLLSEKLKQELFGHQVESFFAQNRLDFEQVLLYQIIVPYEKTAREVFYQIEEREISFYEAAHVYDIDEQRRHQCGYEGVVYRSRLMPALAAVIFGATAGVIIPPVQTESGFHLLLAEEFIPAQLTPEVRQHILNRLFQEWLLGELNYLLHQ